MSQDKLVLIVIAAVAALAFVAARPAEYKEFVVSEVANKTMCPIKVEIDDDPMRIPRRIKYLKCADRPNSMCNQHHISHGCCKRHHHSYRTECVEIYDFVQVTYKNEPGEYATIKVPVGCTCLIEESTVAVPVGDGP